MNRAHCQFSKSIVPITYSKYITHHGISKFTIPCVNSQNVVCPSLNPKIDPANHQLPKYSVSINSSNVPCPSPNPKFTMRIADSQNYPVSIADSQTILCFLPTPTIYCVYPQWHHTVMCHHVPHCTIHSIPIPNCTVPITHSQNVQYPIAHS